MMSELYNLLVSNSVKCNLKANNFLKEKKFLLLTNKWTRHMNLNKTSASLFKDVTETQGVA